MSPTPEHADAHRSRPGVGLGLAAGVALFAAFTLWRYALAHPLAWPGLGTDASLAPELAKGLRGLSALGFVAVLNLAAW